MPQVQSSQKYRTEYECQGIIKVMKMILTALITGLLLIYSCHQNEPNTQNQPVLNEGNNMEQTVELLYMGQASLRVVTETDKVIYIDPY